MNENKISNSFLSVKDSHEITHKDAAVSTESSSQLNNGTSTRTTYGSISWLLSYIKMFMKRFLKDLLITIIGYFCCDQILPVHITELMNVQRSLRSERETQTVTYRRYNLIKRKCSLLVNDTSNQTNSLTPADNLRPINTDISETSLDVHVPTFTGRSRSICFRSATSLVSIEEDKEELNKVVDYLHEDSIFLESAEVGDDKRLASLLSKKETDIQQLDHLGRNALHMAVCAGNEISIRLLLEAGVRVNVKDNVGMTPLSLCLMRNQSLKVANLLFEHGAIILPRGSCADTGLFLQFVMMCIPTKEHEQILELLVKKGALVNDPNAPGGRQALHIAAMSNNCDLILKLVELGAKLHIRNHRGETPKEFATIFKCKEAIALLEELENLASPCISSESSADSGEALSYYSPERSSSSERMMIARKVTIAESKSRTQ